MHSSQTGIKQSIDDEIGDGDANPPHSWLFLQSCNATCQALYGQLLIVSEDLVLNETRRLTAGALELLCHHVHRMLGATLAQEKHALPQLTLLYAGLDMVRWRMSREH